MRRGAHVKSQCRRSGTLVFSWRGWAIVRWDNQHPDYDCGMFHPFLALERVSGLSEVGVGHP